MPTDVRKRDLRIVKTAKLLNTTMFTLLGRSNFGKITVRDICEEALISRATFYARFTDKYDFLKNWLTNLKPDGIDIDVNNEKAVNDFIYKNKTVIKNLIYEADSETLKILSEFILSIFNLPKEYDIRRMNPNQIVLYNFYTGGLICYFQWLANNKFPEEIKPINPYLLEIIEKFKEWVSESI